MAVKKIDFRCTYTPLGIRCYFPYSRQVVTDFKAIKNSRFIQSDKSWVVSPLTKESIRHFVRFTQRYGINLPTNLTKILQEDLYPDTNNQVLLVGEKLAITFTYNEYLATHLKAIGALWDTIWKAWIIAPNKTQVKALASIVKKEGFYISKDATTQFFNVSK